MTLPATLQKTEDQVKSILSHWPRFSTCDVWLHDGTALPEATVVENRDTILGLSYLFDKVRLSIFHRPKAELGFLSVPVGWVLRVQSTISNHSDEWAAGFKLAKRAQEVLPGQHDQWLIHDPQDGIYFAIFHPLMAIDRRHHVYEIRQIMRSVPVISKRYRAGRRGLTMQEVNHVPLPNGKIQAVQVSYKGWSL